jgi:hypothetical protein
MTFSSITHNNIWLSNFLEWSVPTANSRKLTLKPIIQVSTNVSVTANSRKLTLKSRIQVSTNVSVTANSRKLTLKP